MTSKGKVKVIKKGTQKAVEPIAKAQKIKAKEAAREMVSNVSNWVADFQQRRRDETQQAIEQLFGKQPQTNNA